MILFTHDSLGMVKAHLRYEVGPWRPPPPTNCSSPHSCSGQPDHSNKYNNKSIDSKTRTHSEHTHTQAAVNHRSRPDTHTQACWHHTPAQRSCFFNPFGDSSDYSGQLMLSKMHAKVKAHAITYTTMRTGLSILKLAICCFIFKYIDYVF